MPHQKELVFSLVLSLALITGTEQRPFHGVRPCGTSDDCSPSPLPSEIINSPIIASQVRSVQDQKKTMASQSALSSGVSVREEIVNVVQPCGTSGSCDPASLPKLKTNSPMIAALVRSSQDSKQILASHAVLPNRTTEESAAFPSKRVKRSLGHQMFYIVGVPVLRCPSGQRLAHGNICREVE